VTLRRWRGYLPKDLGNMTMKELSHDERMAKMREMQGRDPNVKRLWGSPQFSQVVGSLEGKRSFVGAGKPPSLGVGSLVTSIVQRGLAEPDVAETMTASERRRLAQTIINHTEGLREALRPFMDERRGFKWPFQPYFDRLALEVQISEEERLTDAGVPMDGEAAHRCRFAVYHLLMDKMDWLFDAIKEGAEHFSESETILKKPNDPNAKRLYFLRTVTKQFCMEFRSPCRAATLALASVYFDCTDLDEAAVSKLAPVVKPTPVEISQEEFDEVVGKMERTLEFFASKEDADPEQIEELRENLSKLREKSYKVQVN
jgi:hypothetical protein